MDLKTKEIVIRTARNTALLPCKSCLDTSYTVSRSNYSIQPYNSHDVTIGNTCTASNASRTTTNRNSSIE